MKFGMRRPEGDRPPTTAGSGFRSRPVATGSDTRASAVPTADRIGGGDSLGFEREQELDSTPGSGPA